MRKFNKNFRVRNGVNRAQNSGIFIRVVRLIRNKRGKMAEASSLFTSTLGLNNVEKLSTNVLFSSPKEVIYSVVYVRYTRGVVQYLKCM